MTTTAARPPLVRAIGRWALTAAIINTVVGSGVFGLPAALAGLAGGWSPVAVLIAGAGILLIVLCFAEVASRFDEAGGPYLYTREAFGPAVGFQIGWLHIWTRLLSAAAVLNVLILYLGVLMPWAAGGVGRAVVMIGAVALATGVNVRGVRPATWTVNAFTIAKLLPLAALIVLGITRVDGNVLAAQGEGAPRWTDAVLLLIFAYGGFESGIVAASETRAPKRDSAFALLAAMLAITAIYALVQLTIVGVLPDASSQPAPVGATLGLLIGPAGITLGSVAVIISVYGWLTGFALMTPRILFAMSERAELPGFLAHVHPDTRIPDRAIVVNAVVALALGLASDFGQLATFAAISRLGIFATTCGALIVLRKKWGEPTTYRTPGGRALAVIAIAFCIWLLATRSLAQAWLLPVVVVSGAVVWAWMRRGRVAVASQA